MTVTSIVIIYATLVIAYFIVRTMVVSQKELINIMFNKMSAEVRTKAINDFQRMKYALYIHYNRKSMATLIKELQGKSKKRIGKKRVVRTEIEDLTGQWMNIALPAVQKGVESGKPFHEVL